MAKVYTLEELLSKHQEFRSKMSTVIGLIIEARTERENLFAAGESADEVDRLIAIRLTNIETVADQISTDQTALSYANAIEVRLGNGRDLFQFDIDADPGSIICEDKEGAVVTALDDGAAASLFVNADKVEILNPEDAANAKRLITLAGTQTTSVLDFAAITGMSDNASDEKASIILRER